MRELLDIIEFCNQRRDQDLVLATLVRKNGSSYRGLGAKKVFARNGDSQGFLSGGCLEADIGQVALEAWEALPRIESFSTVDEADRFFGTQAGCRGIIDILFERIPKERTALDLWIPFGPTSIASGVRVSLDPTSLGHRRFANEEPTDGAFFERWKKPVTLTMVGCGPETSAIAALAKTLGWELVLLDYRRERAVPGRFDAKRVETVPLPELASRIPLGERAAIVLATHHYEADLEVMSALVDREFAYLGCIGSRERFESMKKDLASIYGKTIPERSLSKISSPAGLIAKCRAPSELAVSIVSEIQSKLMEETDTARPWTLILAAGASTRFDGVKALARLGEETFLARAISVAQSVTGPNVLVALGAYADLIRPFIDGAETFTNEYWREGMGATIARGFEEILARDPDASDIIVYPVDQPLIDPGHLQALLKIAHDTSCCALSVQDEAMGPPAVVPRNLFAHALALKGESGLKSKLSVEEMIGVQTSQALTDIDSRAALAALRSWRVSQSCSATL